MATNERSYAWATGVAGTDGATTYDSSRFVAMQSKQNGTSGVVYTGSNFALSGITTTTLSIANGAAMVGGYFYETNGTITISATGLNGSYQIVIIANTSAGVLTVSANGSGTTTVVASTTRAAIVTSAQKTTITSAVGSANVVQLATITISGGTITAYELAPDFSYTPTYPSNHYIQLQGAPNTSVGNATPTALTYNTASAGYAFMSATPASGIITILGAKLVLAEVVVQWDSNATGNRAVYVASIASTFDAQYETTPATSLSTVSTYKTQRYTQTIEIDSAYKYLPVTFTATAYQDSGGIRNCNAWLFRITRLA